MSGHATRRRKAIDDDNGEYPLDEIDQAEIVRKLELSNARSNLLFSRLLGMLALIAGLFKSLCIYWRIQDPLSLPLDGSSGKLFETLSALHFLTIAALLFRFQQAQNVSGWVWWVLLVSSCVPCAFLIAAGLITEFTWLFLGNIAVSAGASYAASLMRSSSQQVEQLRMMQYQFKTI